jgi:predicted outer membrane repeat protein
MKKQNIFQIALLAVALFMGSAAMAQSKIYYVSPTGTGDGSSWANTMSLEKALTTAKAGDQIWVLGFETITDYNQIYITPTIDGFTLNSGVQLYGGFKGDETTLDARETLGKPYQLKYRSVLSGDINKDDEIDNTNLIYPANTTRKNNAAHVLSINMAPSSGGNNNTYPTVVNGFSIGGGQADGTDEKGGGIYIYGDNTNGGIFRIERCFFVNNYATQGGAIYVEAEVQNRNNNESLINQCVVYNNAAGERAAVVNAGGGIYLAGQATVVNSSIFNNENGGLRLSTGSKVINSTVARNSGAGIDMLETVTDFSVFNTIIWGNNLLSAEFTPNFKHSAYHEATTGDGNDNIYVTKENRGDKDAPMFDAPSVKTSFDRDFNWRQMAYPLWSWNVLEGSVMHDKGDGTAYQSTTYGNQDMAGNPRMDGVIDIGAYEYQKLPTGRIRYVKPTATGTGDGSSWNNASGDLQKMIDELADNNPQNQAGEVWVAAGTYAPQAQLISGTAYSASFRMRDGISVYGGFAGTETTKQERAKGTMPWDFTNVTILEAAYYDHNNFAWNNKWTLTSDSRHVVWFAPMANEAAFSRVTTLDGVTIRGGYAQGGTGLDDFKTDRGAGVYMDGANAYLTNCIVKENYATGNGGGVYLKDGRVETSFIYNNNADADGGAVYVDNRGLVLRSMLANNSAHNGAGAYLHNEEETLNDHPEYLILSTCVVSNNTMSGNGAVYCDKGGVLMQNTITNNNCVTATDATNSNASQTGGIYVDEYALVVNSVIWNNQMGKTGGTNIPMYARNPSASKVRFLYNAISGVNNAVWNYTLQEQTLSLVDENAGKQDDGGSIGPRFTEPDTDMKFDLETNYGVQEGWKDNIISYYWKPISGSNLWGRGMALGQLPEEVVLTPEMDIEGNLFAQKPAVGAFMVTATPIQHETTDDALTVYMDVECTEPDHTGKSWATAYRSLNDAISYLAGLDATTVGSKRLIVRVLEGDLWPRYAFTNNDPKTATITVPVTKSGKAIEIYGGYYRDNVKNTVSRDPLNHRSVINGNTEGKDIKAGLYHCITVQQDAKLVLDGFHVINGYAAGEASRQYGAGLLAHAGSTVTVRNCIFENNTAQDGAAIDAREATLTLQNCVVNNNTNTDAGKPVINAKTLTMNHVTVVNNVGAAPADMGASSFSAGNTSGNTIENLASIGEAGAKNFANPTNKAGATLGFDTYLGGYSVFRPMTSSVEAGTAIINQAPTSTLNTDITVINDRDLGGASDLGAYEAILPKAGKIIYVRSYNQNAVAEETDGNPNFNLLKNNPNKIIYDGTSWDRAINGNAVCDLNIERGTNNFYVLENNNSLIRASIERNDYANSGRAYGPQSNFYSGFWANDSKNTNGTYSYIINNNRDERYVSGLQYAVEKAKEANDNLTADEDSVVVWVGAGIYTDYKGFVIRDGVKVYGGFPKTGNPGEDDRKPLLSGYIPKNNNDNELNTVDYETILQIRKETPVTWNGNTPTTANFINSISGTERHYVLYQPDVCMTTWAPDNNNTGYWGANSYRYPGSGSGYIDNNYYKEYKGALWDGFTVRHGYIKNYEANRDGGAGIRTFRGVTLQNMVVVNNYCHGSRSRGGGLYMDGLNSTMFNSFLLHNMVDGAESYGGGAYMIVGTGYNMAVANNYSNIAGGGLFIESATFYNNTVAFNKANGSVSGVGNGSGIFQYADGNARLSKLLLYNCIFYGNVGSGNNTNYQITSNTTGTFENAHNCYVAGSIYKGLNNKFTATDGNQTGTNLANPFEKVTSAQSDNNYRLSATSTCVNKGTENITGITLPETDMDYTARIKDCTIDIGAYERSNQDNVMPDANGYYYVTQNGAGTASGNSPENAACAMKLQEVLNAAGEYAKKGNTPTVKIAGYANSTFIYHPNTLSNANDPQSYTYVVPEGIIVEGGYNDQFTNENNEIVKAFTIREPLKYKTVLSAISEANASTIQTVRGYHAVTFGAWPGTATLTKETIIDGLWLEDGSATSMAGTGNPNTRGGGAIVPSGAHVRNCVVRNCAAIEGGGLYLLPGATVSGTAVIECEATNGAGIYADNTDADNTEVDKDSRAHILSCTIANNEASSTGGGLYMEDGAVMSVNTVIFDNRAGSDKNVSGVVSEQFEDTLLNDVYDMTGQKFYPFNNCFVETQEMPSDFENRMLESDKSLYFADDYYRLKDYSFLIKHGVKNEYQTALVTTFNVATQDMQNIDRIQTGNAAERLDAGAFAYEGGILPTDLFTRIFVSQTTNVTLPDDENMNTYLGRSFYTSFSTLEDALGYIRSMRSNGQATNTTTFEILVAGGTYKPSYLRTTDAKVDHDQKLYSFVVPEGVSIYGGFSGTEKYSSSSSTDTNGFTEIGTVVTDLKVDGDINEILAARAYSDFNQNNILEPWELANQTILSGQINASSTAQNAYHVVFTDKGTATTVNPVVLDGLTVMYGQTDNKLSISTDNNEQGRGGGIYSNGVTYTISRCRLLNNTAVRGGAVFVRNADLNLSGCILAGNKTVANTAQGTNTLTSRGGAAYVSGIDEEVNLRAVNTLWANNESAGEGGAIGTNDSGKSSSLYILNNTFVRNKAATRPVLYAAAGNLTNTLMWGNEGSNSETSLNDLTVSHCASDVDYAKKFGTGTNILLSKENMADKGPRFTNPSTVAGVDGNSASSLWNPVAISVLTDAGNGTEHNSDQTNEDEDDHTANTTTGAYQDWFDPNTGYLGKNGVTEAYITNDGDTYSRYSGPLDQNNNELCKPIDIGLYEYQYISNFSTMPAIYVDTTSQGDGSGNSWANATDDLRGAIVGAANPTDNVEQKRVVYVRDGNYSWNKTSAGSAYILNMLDDVKNISLTLKGSCTGSGDQQDFSKQTVLRNDGATTNLMSVSTNSKPVTIEGFTFINDTQDTQDTGKGMDASTGSGGSLTLKNCGFRISNKGLDITGNSGKMLIYNTLFADGGTGLSGADSQTTVVNATFANNDKDIDGTANVYNSVSWKNTDQNLPTGNNNVSIDGTVANDNVNNGPNFRNPDNSVIESRDYRIRPSVQLLNKGNNELYLTHVVKVVADANANATAIPATEVDLGNNDRLVDKTIDIGAYEYEAPLQPIVYVKADLTGTADGKSWETALGDLQGAVDLAGLYANNNSTNGYVFVHGNYHDTGLLNLTLGNTKVYGGMNDERSDKTVTSDIVSDLLAKRKGMLEATNRSSLENVTITANGVIDGFEVTGAATVNAGALSTSVVKNNVSGAADGLLYNSLVLGDGTTDHPGNVSGVTTVNVTATGTITEAADIGNNRASATGNNTYVTDEYWNYQLMETSSDIDPTDTRTDISTYITKVGHSRDLIGNARIRNTVDNGCFETWNISSDYAITADDYPVGKSVVYVRKRQELSITADVYPNGNAFNPGFLLLEHQAGLRGNGNYISLTNFAVERDIPAGGADLVAMPFDVNSTTSELAELTPKCYDGSIRAAYDYKFDKSNSRAWTTKDLDLADMYEGLLFENTTEQDKKLRFYGKSTAPYTENGKEKSILLKKYNFNESWASGATGGNRFTHKENMSWNLFGSPYLCAMNYSDLQYGRVLYGYENGYKTVNTSNNTTVEGHIPSGSAVFTQTATLKYAEIFTVAQPTDSKSGTAFENMTSLSLAISPVGSTRTTDDEETVADVLQLNAVESSEARTDFDMGADGVKWMAEDRPQIYAEQNGGRYSLLSAVDKAGSVQIGLSVPQTGMYSLYIPADCDAYDYETVVLEDKLTGTLTDLKEDSYTFNAPQAGDLNDRFQLYFNRSVDEAESNIRVVSTTAGQARVLGIQPGDVIRVYNTQGMLVEQRKADATEATFSLPRGIHLFKVTTADDDVVKKAAVR